MSQAAATSFDTVDWDFGDAKVSTGVHAIHPYPAKFIAQIPRQLLQLYQLPAGSVLLDPFCGSGTTLVEGIDAGFDVCGVDLNPIACLISRVKTTLLPSPLNNSVASIINTAKANLACGPVQVPKIPNLDHWFKQDVQQALAALVAGINVEQSVPVREALQVALSSIIVRVSNQESDTRYAAIEKKVISAENVLEFFKRSALAISRALTERDSDLFTRPRKATILARDLMALSPEELPNNVGLVITSPPYPNAYEYWLYHKYRMYWLGLDPIKVRTDEIGARPHYFKKNHQDESDFEAQMGRCFDLLSKVMLLRAKACFLVGRSIIHGRVIDNRKILERAAELHGFLVEETIERRIPTTRKAFNPSNSRINQEQLIVFSLDERK
jgi:site-specific DNA-methyltransferase (cytosine-N4-specific)